MKVTKIKPKPEPEKFKRFAIAIEFETLEETQAFKAVFNHSAIVETLGDYIDCASIKEQIEGKYTSEFHNNLCAAFKKYPDNL